jgi:hypothetical protein
MKKKEENKKAKEEENIDLPGYPIYPASEDIYNNDKEEKDLDPEDISKKKEPVEKDHPGKLNEKNFSRDMSGNDLDIPGSELDEAEENMGSEDEENNFYSLGGDDHNDLEEDNG